MAISAWLADLLAILPELVAGLTLVVTSLSAVFAYLNYRSQVYTSIDARQVELSKALDGNTVTYAYSQNQEAERIGIDSSTHLRCTFPLHVSSTGRFLENLVDRYDLHNKTEQSLRQAEDLDELSELIEESDSDSNEFPQLKQKVNEIQGDGLATIICEDILYSYLPQFLYFDEYSIMDGDVWIDQLRSGTITIT